MQPQAVLVTGASGLIGHRVSELLLARGDRVISTDLVGPADSSLDVEVCDLTDRKGLERLADSGIAAVIHCGGFSGPMVGTSTPDQLLEVNVGATISLLEIGRRQGIRRFVFASSGTVVGPTEGEWVTEDVTPQPANLYAASKAACEHLVTAYSSHFSEGALSLRLAWVYGPRRTTDCFIRDAILDAQAGRTTELPYGHGFPRQFMYVDDAAAALVAALDVPGPTPRSVYNATGDDYSTLDQVAELVAAAIPASDITLDPGDAPLDVRQSRFDVRAIECDLGFVPKVSLAQGIKDYAQWLKRSLAWS